MVVLSCSYCTIPFLLDVTPFGNGGRILRLAGCKRWQNTCCVWAGGTEGFPMQSWQISRYIENILFACILASVFVSVQKWSFRLLLSLRYLNSLGMNLNWGRINLREKEKQLSSSQYDNIP